MGWISTIAFCRFLLPVFHPIIFLLKMRKRRQYKFMLFILGPQFRVLSVQIPIEFQEEQFIWMLWMESSYSVSRYPKKLLAISITRSPTIHLQLSRLLTPVYVPHSNQISVFLRNEKCGERIELKLGPFFKKVASDRRKHRRTKKYFTV